MLALARGHQCEHAAGVRVAAPGRLVIRLQQINQRRVACCGLIKPPPDPGMLRFDWQRCSGFDKRRAVKGPGAILAQVRRYDATRRDDKNTRARLREKRCGVDCERANAVARVGEHRDEGGKIRAAVRGKQAGYVFQRDDRRRVGAERLNGAPETPEGAGTRGREPATRAGERKILTGKRGPGQIGGTRHGGPRRVRRRRPRRSRPARRRPCIALPCADRCRSRTGSARRGRDRCGQAPRRRRIHKSGLPWLNHYALAYDRIRWGGLDRRSSAG